MKTREMLLILIIYSLIHLITSVSIDIELNKKQPIENEDICLRRPYYKTAEPFYFAPVLRAKLKEVGDKFSFGSRCFKKNIVTFKEMSTDIITFTLENSEKKETFCSELFIFHSSNINFFQFVAFEGNHEIVLKRVTSDDKDEIKVNGVKLVSFCNGLITTIKSLIKTIDAVYGGLGYDTKAKNPKFRPNIPKKMEKANLRILELFNHYTPERRNNTIVKIDKSVIKSGDFLAISRMDFIDPLIMIGHGGHIGHTAVCSWIDGELYVLESQDGWYWPRAGIQKNKWEQWIEWAYNADFNVAILPLREEYRKKFDVIKANEWFASVEGLPYGYHNFIMSWVNTLDKNFPFVGTHEDIEILFGWISKIYPSLTDSFLTEALNIRVGKKGLSFQQAIAEASRQGKSFEELIAEPEKEGIEYSDGLSYICSCFVTAFWEHGGLFGDLEISPNEFGPRDVYIVDIYDKNFEKPQECIDDNPDLPYCQLMGKFILTLDNYSTITPYSHMNEHCPSQGPDFIREDGC